MPKAKNKGANLSIHPEKSLTNKTSVVAVGWDLSPN